MFLKSHNYMYYSESTSSTLCEYFFYLIDKLQFVHRRNILQPFYDLRNTTAHASCQKTNSCFA